LTTQNTIEENKQIVRAFIETAFNQQEADRAADYLMPDMKWHGGTLGTVEGREKVAGLVSAIVSALPDCTTSSRTSSRNAISWPYARSSRRRTRETSSGSPRRADTSDGMQSTCTAWPTGRSPRSGLQTTFSPLSTALEPIPLPGSPKFSNTGSAGRTAYKFRRSATAFAVRWRLGPGRASTVGRRKSDCSEDARPGMNFIDTARAYGFPDESSSLLLSQSNFSENAQGNDPLINRVIAKKSAVLNVQVYT
jgi:hypothetical protein